MTVPLLPAIRTGQRQDQRPPLGYAPEGADEADHRRHPEADAEGVQRGQPHRLGRGTHLLRRLALFPALIALLSIIGLLTDPKTLTDALTAVVPGEAADTLNPVVEGIAASDSKAGFGLILGLAAAVWSASGYVGAFTRAANVVYETPEGRKIWKLKPLQLLVHADRHPVRRRHRRDAGAERAGRRRRRAGHRRR